MTSRPKSSGAGGFTLLEMIIVLVVISLMLSIVVSRGPTRSRTLSVRVAVTQIVQTLRQARGTAIAANIPVMVAINGEQHRLTVTGGRTVQMPPEYVLTAMGGLAGLPTAKLAGIRFDPNGSSSGGRIVLADGQRHVLVGVDWLTGRVSVANAP